MKQKNHRLNSVSAGTEAVMNVVLALFSLCCIIPFIFVVIISFSGGIHPHHRLFLLAHGVEHGHLRLRV